MSTWYTPSRASPETRFCSATEFAWDCCPEGLCRTTWAPWNPARSSVMARVRVTDWAPLLTSIDAGSRAKPANSGASRSPSWASSRVWPGSMLSSSPPARITTGSGLVSGAVKVRVVCSKVRLLPSSRMVIDGSPSGLVKAISTLPLRTSTVTLPHSTTTASPAFSERISAWSQALMVAGSGPPSARARMPMPLPS